jgi:4-amino-4-deoxy-L-arabinose transferase-like glycosyltransferase
MASRAVHRIAPFLILAIALLVLGIGIERARVGETFSDPAGGFRSQDESLFANSAITMALRGDWMTPKFLGRIYLFKPPLQFWVSAISMKAFDISLLSLRLPILIAGACGVLLLFDWGRRSTSLAGGFVIAALLLSDPMWHIFSRIYYTDMLATVFIAAALYFVARDPKLEKRSTILGFGFSSAAAVMTKSAAGALPILVLFLFALLIRRELRPGWMRILQACLLAAVLVAPWHLYELLTHRRWFWADYVETQLLGYGTHPPFQLTSEFPLAFYAKRLFWTDPVLLILALIALPALVMALRRRDSVLPVLLAAWLLIVCLSLSSFQARGNFRWVLLLLPPLCLLAGCLGPLATGARQRWLVGILCVAFAVKASARTELWGLSFGATTPLPAISLLRAYAARERPNPLVLVEADDELYSASLPLPKIHYLWIDPSGGVQRLAPHYAYLGITVTADQFDDLPRWEPEFRARLREWDLDSDEPIATAVVADTDADVAKVIVAHPEADYYLPERFRPSVAAGAASTHELVPASPERFFLLSRQSPKRPANPPTFQLPQNW